MSNLIRNYKPMIVTVAALIVILIIVVAASKMEKFSLFEAYDSLNGQLNPFVKEKPSDFGFLVDKKSGILMSGSELNRDDMEGRFVPLDHEEVPINVIAPDSFLLDDGNNGRTGLHTNLCSKECCSAQYPVPFRLKHDERLCNLKNFVPSNLTCNNAWQDSGCLCLTKDQADNLYNRGGNGST